MALHTNKDKQMAATLKAKGEERTHGICCICYKLISNAGAYNHYCQHAWGNN